jgi:hypothetical protein
MSSYVSCTAIKFSVLTLGYKIHYQSYIIKMKREVAEHLTQCMIFPSKRSHFNLLLINGKSGSYQMLDTDNLDAHGD